MPRPCAVASLPFTLAAKVDSPPKRISPREGCYVYRFEQQDPSGSVRRGGSQVELNHFSTIPPFRTELILALRSGYKHRTPNGVKPQSNYEP